MLARTMLAVLVFAALAAPAVIGDEGWESLPDGSQGKTTEFRGTGGLVIPAYIRKPKGDGPFPVIVMLHGGRYRKGASAGLGRSTKAPVVDFLQAGWAVFCTDYRSNDKISIEPIETEDTIEALKAVRKLPFLDPRRVGLWGTSHGANVSSQVISRADLSGVILCAPAAMDLIEVKKADARGEPVVPILRKLIGDMEKKYGATAEEIEKDPAKYGYSSPLLETEKVRCPVLILNARDDDNSPVSIMELYVKKLQAAGKTVVAYLPETGGHGFYVGRPDGPEYQESTRRSVAFFTECFQQGQALEAKKPTLDQYGSLNWVDPDRTAPPGTMFKTFRSKTLNADVSYLVYLPPGYDKEPTARYPVLYSLHASGGTPARDAGRILNRMDQLIRAGRVEPLIIVFPNGLRGATMYCDTRDGKYPVETVIVQDLIPHIDASYRTVAGRTGRALDGFSMGGFGAAHLGFKYPEVFGVVSIQAPPLLDPELKSPLPARAWSRLFPTAMGGDLDYFRRNDPFTLAAQNADALRDRSVIRIIAHAENENWLVPRCDELHRVLQQHGIAHHLLCLTNVKGHSPSQVLDTLGDPGLMFFTAAFHYLARQTPSKPSGPQEKPSGSLSFSVGAVIKKVDAENGLVTFSAGGMDRTVRVVKEIKVLDREGKELKDGLEASELKEGAEVTVTIERQGDRPFLRMIRLGRKGPQPLPRKEEKVETRVDTSHLVPLTDLGQGQYQGFPGGLYPDGKNQRPAEHEAAGLARARLVRPLDAAGKPSAEGKIVLLSIGFSNTVQVFKGFMDVAREDPAINPHLVLVNGAVGGVPASEAQKEDGKAPRGLKYWEEVDRKLKEAGVTAQQVQVVWLKETNPAPHNGQFPTYTRELQGQIEKIVQLLQRRFPNLLLVYLSSRTYAGWARVPPDRPQQRGPGNSEPYSYETGFAVKWVIEKQLQGDPELNCDPKKGAVKAPWLSWGPYLWANGTIKRKDGYSFEPSDFQESDRMHHSAQGMKKNGMQLLQFFKSDPTTREWFLKR